MPLVAVAQHLHIDCRIAAIGQGPPYRVHIFRIDVLVERDDIFADSAMLRDKPIHRAPDFDARRVLLHVQDNELAQIGQRLVQRHPFDAAYAQALAQTLQ